MQTRQFTRGLILIVFQALLVCGLYSRSAAGAGLEVGKVSLDTGRMDRFLEAEALKLGREAWQRFDSRDKLEGEKEKLHQEFLFMLGLDPLPERTPLQATLVRTIERRDYFIDVLYYQSLPGFYVTANLYRPRNGKGPFPAVIWGPGHGGGVYAADPPRQ